MWYQTEGQIVQLLAATRCDLEPAESLRGVLHLVRRDSAVQCYITITALVLNTTSWKKGRGLRGTSVLHKSFLLIQSTEVRDFRQLSVEYFLSCLDYFAIALNMASKFAYLRNLACSCSPKYEDHLLSSGLERAHIGCISDWSSRPGHVRGLKGCGA